MLVTKTHVREAMLAKLAGSGLGEEDAAKLGMKPYINGEAKELTGFDTPGFKIPYFTVEGRPTDFWRYRRLDKKTGEPVGKKGTKYVQPKDSMVFVYFPPLVDWPAIARDSSKDLIITEGELKAACATKHGFNTIGLGGVWSFKSKKKGVEFLHELEAFEWAGRKVYICYDSDAMTNAKVMDAECALAKELLKRGAKPYAVRLPSVDEHGKTGIDDFIVDKKHGGVKRFKHVLDTTEEWKRSAALHDFNREVIFIRDPGVCVVRASGQRVDAHTLVNPLYANRLFQKPAPTQKDPLKTVEASVPQEWLKWTGRAEAQKITYAPGKPEITDENEYNMWKGWGATPKKGNVAPWKKLLDFLFKDATEADRRWFEQWCAYPIKYPGTKMYTAVVLWSTAQGTGKTLVGYTLGRIYGDNFREIKDADLSSSFNGWAVGRQFILGDEITGNSGGEKRQLANRLKGMITQESILVNQKYVPEYQIPDRINYLWTSNHCDAFFLEDRDRRYFVIEIKGAPLPFEWYRTVYDKWYKSQRGIDALMHHLINDVDMTGFDPFAPAPMTDAKKTMIEENRSDLADWIANLVDHPQAKTIMSSEEILLLATGAGKTTWTKNGISRALHAAGYVRPLGNQQQLILEDGRAVRPWLIKRLEAKIPEKRHLITQALMRELWNLDRVKHKPMLAKKKFRANKPSEE